MTLSFETQTPAQTKKLGERLTCLLKVGDVLLIQGELGAGKTCLAQGIGRGLQVNEVVKSSSFVLVNEYNGRLKVYHADLFRLDEPEQVVELALEENAADGLLLVEWPERALGEMPLDHLLVRIEVRPDQSRLIDLEAHGQRYDELLRLWTQSPPSRKPAG